MKRLPLTALLILVGLFVSSPGCNSREKPAAPPEQSKKPDDATSPNKNDEPKLLIKTDDSSPAIMKDAFPTKKEDAPILAKNEDKEAPPLKKDNRPPSAKNDSKEAEPRSKRGPIKIGWITNNPADWWKVVEAGAKVGAKDLDVSLNFQTLPLGTVEVQNAYIKASMYDGVNGLIISPIDLQEQETLLKDVDRRIPLVAVESDAVLSLCLAYVGANNYESGKAAGKRIKEILPDGGTVALFVGLATIPSAKERIQGILDELAGEKDAKGPKFGKYMLFQGEVLTDGGNPQMARQKAVDALQRLRGENNVVLVGMWAYNPPALLNALKEMGQAGKMKIVGFDEDDATLEGIRKGEIDSTIVQQPFEFGYRSVRALVTFLKDGKKPVNARILIPHQVITAANVDAFANKLKEYREAK